MTESNIKQQTKKGLYWTFFNKFSNYGLHFFVGIIMARLLTPADFGITALPAVFIVIASVFVNGGFSSAMIRKPKITDSDITTAFIYSMIVGTLCYIILFLSAPSIAAFYDTPILTSLIRVVALSFLWTPLQTPQTIILQRQLDFKTPAKIAVVSNIIGAIFGVTLAYKGYGVWSLVAMSVFTAFLTFVLTWSKVRWLPKGGWSNESFSYLWNFGNKLMVSALLDSAYSNIVPVIVGKFYSTSELGIYNRAQGYASLPAQQGTSVIQSVAYPVLSRMQDDKDALARNYRKMIRVSAFVIFPVMTLLAGLAKPVIVLMVTDKWIDSVLLLQLICFSMMWYPVHALNLNLLQVKGRPDLFLKLEIWKKCLGLTVMCSTLPFGLVYFVVAGIISSIISLVINTYYTGKLIDVGFITQMRDLLPIYLLSFASFIVALGTGFIFSNLLIHLVVGLSAGSIIYIGSALLLKFDEITDIKYVLKFK